MLLSSFRNNPNLWTDIVDIRQLPVWPITFVGQLVVNADRIWTDFRVSRFDDPRCGCWQQPVVDDCKEWQTQVFFPVVDSVICEMKRLFLEHEIMKGAEAACRCCDDVWWRMRHRLLLDRKLYGGIIHVNSALAKTEMNIIKYSVDVLKRFKP